MFYVGLTQVTDNSTLKIRDAVVNALYYGTTNIYTRSIAGGTGALAPGQTHVISIPDGATTLKLTGHGSDAVVSTVFNWVYSISNGTNLTRGASPLTLSEPRPSSIVGYTAGTVWYISGIHSNQVDYWMYLAYDTSTNTWTGTGARYERAPSIPASSVTVSGAVTASFAGSSTTVQTKTLAAGTGRTVTVVIPTSGAMQLDWS